MKRVKQEEVTKPNVRLAGSDCNCGHHKLLGGTWYVWGPRGKVPLETVPLCVPEHLVKKKNR